MPDIGLTQDQHDTVNAIFHDLTNHVNGIEGVMAAVDMWNENPGLYDAMHAPNADGLTIRNPGPDATRMTEKYLRKVSQAAPDWVAGMQNPKANFRDAAIAAKGKWSDGVTRAMQNDSFARGMGAVDVAEAIATATSDNGNAYVAGVNKRKAKVGRAFTKLAPALGAISSSIRSMPQDTPADREQRMLKNLQLMRELKGRLKGA